MSHIATNRTKALNLGYSEKMLLALLRASLHQQEVETVYFQHATEEDWLKCYRLAVRQGVASLAWNGIERLPANYNPPLNVKLSWALRENEQIEEYRKQCHAANDLTKLLAQHNIATVILKGIGLSRFYPVPAHRESGDIDIYTYSADKTLMTDEEANSMADEIIIKHGATIYDLLSKKHSRFGLNGVTLENHKMFLDEDECRATIMAEQWLKKHFDTQIVELLDGECQIEVPSITFDSVFVSLHAALHHGIGISLKHLCDWVLLLQQKDMNLSFEYNEKYFNQTTIILTQLCNQYLGLNIPIKGDYKIANKMMQEILYPPYFGKTPTGGFFKTHWFQIQNRIHIFKLKHSLLGVSIRDKIRRLLSRIIKNQDTI